MISMLIVICNHANYKAFDHGNISEVLAIYLLVTYLFVCKFNG